MKRNLLTLILICCTVTVFSQVNPLGSMYFQNKYFFNPAMAGTEPGWALAAALKAQWTSIDGAPTMQNITADFGSANKKVGAGINFYNESAGVIKRTSLKGTYAYHLSLNKGSYIDFGLSGGFMNEWIDFNKVTGDLGDVSLSNFNQRKLYFDGDFGIAYRSDQLTLQGSLPNLKRFFKRDLLRNIVDRALFFTSVSYKIYFKESIAGSSGSISPASIEPLIMFRAIQNYKNIVDAGANLQFYDDKLSFNAMYHSTNSVTLGVGTFYKKQLSISAQYTTNTSDLQSYSNGEFEIGLRYKLKAANKK